MQSTGGFSSLGSSYWGLHVHNSLCSLSIIDTNMESFLEPGLLPTSLTTLYFDCSNLRTSLIELIPKNCHSFQYSPKVGLPTSLSISNCPLLKYHCQKQRGGDWEKIAPLHFDRWWYSKMTFLYGMYTSNSTIKRHPIISSYDTSFFASSKIPNHSFILYNHLILRNIPIVDCRDLFSSSVMHIKWYF